MLQLHHPQHRRRAGEDPGSGDRPQRPKRYVSHTISLPSIYSLAYLALLEYFQVCTDGGRQIPEGTIDDEGRYFDNDSDNDDDWDDNDDGYNSDDDHNNNGGNNGGNNNAGNNGGNTDNGNNNNNNVGGNNDSVNDNADDGSGAASGLRIPAAAVLVGSFALGALAM